MTAQIHTHDKYAPTAALLVYPPGGMLGVPASERQWLLLSSCRAEAGKTRGGHPTIPTSEFVTPNPTRGSAQRPSVRAHANSWPGHIIPTGRKVLCIVYGTIAVAALIGTWGQVAPTSTASATFC